MMAQLLELQAVHCKCYTNQHGCWRSADLNNEENKLYFFDGTDVIAVGPNYTASQGKTFEAVTMIDTSGQTRAILAQYVQGNLVGIPSKAEFTSEQKMFLCPTPQEEL